MIEKIGAPDRIRTHDPQIRRLGNVIESPADFSKPAIFPAMGNQWLRKAVANQKSGPPDPEMRTPAAAATVAGADRKFGTGFQYHNGTSTARYTIDAQLLVTAYHRHGGEVLA